MSKYTPGPWRISRTSGMEIFISHDHDQPNRVPGYFAEVRRFTSDNEQVEANARLIASAPELLEALELVISTYEEGGWPGATMTIVRAAVSKAKGVTA